MLALEEVKPVFQNNFASFEHNSSPLASRVSLAGGKCLSVFAFFCVFLGSFDNFFMFSWTT